MHKYEELENRWKRYSMKRNLRLYFLPSLLVGGGFLLYYLFFLAIHSNEDASAHIPVAAITQEKTTSLSKSEKAEAKKTPEPAQSIAANTVEVPEVKTQTQSNPTLPESTPQILEEPVQSTPVAQTPKEPVTPIQSQPIESLTSPTDPVCYTINVPVLNIREQPYIGAAILGKYRQNDIVCEFERQKGWIRGEFGWVYANNLLPIDTNAPTQTPIVTPTTIGTDSVKPSLHDIINPSEAPASPLSITKTEMTEDERISLLLKRFETNENASTAIELSQYYYENKNYEQSRGWALKANALDSQNEKTWLMFAKSSYQLGQKQEAIKALETLLLQKPDINEAKELLNLYKKSLM